MQASLEWPTAAAALVEAHSELADSVRRLEGLPAMQLQMQLAEVRIADACDAGRGGAVTATEWHA